MSSSLVVNTCSVSAPRSRAFSLGCCADPRKSRRVRRDGLRQRTAETPVVNRAPARRGHTRGRPSFYLSQTLVELSDHIRLADTAELLYPLYNNMGFYNSISDSDGTARGALENVSRSPDGLAEPLDAVNC
ncbi:hypothetical protein EVAR_28707_1 [Eumeta japonica]|uniref:Uncharacterized protein n=1 Tax=Eumeta variegata TaxID=151549 RepID=A0A4C1V5K3_EUMVA|nr:hypothetical protein EVAR_28707_1 [Eumeta japonica]